jgi:hypothetical protein
MNAGTCWGENTIDPSGRGIEKPRKATLTFNLLTATKKTKSKQNVCKLLQLKSHLFIHIK